MFFSLVSLTKSVPEKKFMIFRFVGSALILKPETPALVKEGHTLELTCQSNESGGIYVFNTIDVEGRRMSLGAGGGGFKLCVSSTNQTIIECHFGEIWTFKLTLLNPIHNQTIECSASYTQTSPSTTIFVQGNT